MKFEDKYKRESLKLNQPDKVNGSVAWRSPSNIALIKYWGKKDFQLPQNPSLSFSLDKSFTETSLEYGYKGNRENKGPAVDFKFENQKNPAFETRIKTFLKTASAFMPFLNHFDLKIESHNSFPHSSGIASSASSMSAISLCLVSMEQKLFGSPKDDAAFYQKASFLSRLGSGSATRSTYGGFVVWGKQKGIQGSTDELAINLNTSIAPEFCNLRDAILITSSQSKTVSSSAGHKLMADHPFAAARYLQARTNLEKLIAALSTGDEQAFISITENEALSLHAMMMTSAGGFTLLNENTWNIINRIRQFRAEQKIFITFTLDAGPNVHLIYREREKIQVIRFIKKELLQFCERNNWIDDQAGDGPLKLK